MTAYTWMVILVLLAALLLQGNVKGNKKFIFAAFLILFCVMGLRDVNTVGTDSSGTNGSYPIIYKNVGHSEWSELYTAGEINYNVGSTHLQKLIYDLTDGNYQTYVSLVALFVMFSYMRFIRKYSPSPIQSVLYLFGLMYFTLLFDALKQAMAMSVLLFAFDAIIDKKPIKFILLVLLASTFHFPALVFLPAYWIGRMKVGRSYLILLAAALVITYIFRDQILNLMLDAYGGDDIEGSLEGVRFLRNKVIIMIVVVIAAIVLRPPTEGDTVYNACLVFAGISIVFQTFCGYNNIFERLADYYFHTAIVMMPLAFEKCELKKHLLDINTELMIKNTAPLAFCGFAVWRFLSMVNNSPNFMNIRFLWQ